MSKNQLLVRRILNDSEAALHALGRAVDSRDENWRVPWVAAVAMLRAIGHVLKEIDGANDPQVAQLIQEGWPAWQKDVTFQRLKVSRDRTLKEYDFGVQHHVSAVWSSPYKRAEDDPDAKLYGFLYFEGTAANAIDVLWSIWLWWVEKVTDLERLTGRLPAEETDLQLARKRFMSTQAFPKAP
jgi:hypothetical protein